MIILSQTKMNKQKHLQMVCTHLKHAKETKYTHNKIFSLCERLQ